MKLKRQKVSQAATLSTGAGLQEATRTSSLEPDGGAFLIDVAAADAEEYFDKGHVGVYARLEERWPADPGELSAAKLLLGEDFNCLSVEIGDTLQPDGKRSGHLLGFIERDGLHALATANLFRSPIRSFSVFLTPADKGKETSSDLRLELFTAGVVDCLPELRLHMAEHCFGVLRGSLLCKFLQCVRTRCSDLSEAAPAPGGDGGARKHRKAKAGELADHTGNARKLFEKGRRLAEAMSH
ncbi:MAG TPA: hypothetical protein VGF03_04315 [Bryobacteraceae bacterium]|jgi:hypothetical protein